MHQTEHEAMDDSPALVTRSVSGKFAVTNSEAYRQKSMGTPWLSIKFQCGPIQEVGINGGSIEDVIDVLVERLQGFQKGAFACRENALAITKLEEAKHWLLARTWKRQAQGVEGRDVAHTP